MYIQRKVGHELRAALKKGKSVLLLGPRQTGKTTMINQLDADKFINLANPFDRVRYEKEPFLLTAEVEALAELSQVKPLVIIDEIQKVPILTDAAQDLIDRKLAIFIITGSSARKLRRSETINLLPGRVIPFRLDPFMINELPTNKLDEIILDGTLPEIILNDDIQERENLLEAYVSIYLEEEIRAEALVRDLGSFAKFLEFAASESGKIVNFMKLSQEIGVSHKTISSYYQILEDCLIAERVEPYVTTRTRRKLTKTHKYLFYDLGVKRVAARLGRKLTKEQIGHDFEQFIGLELIRLLRSSQSRDLVTFWRDSSGPEVDWVIDQKDSLIPIEVKWTQSPSSSDAKHLHLFMSEYPQAKHGYIVCRTPCVMKISEMVTAIPWTDLKKVFNT